MTDRLFKGLAILVVDEDLLGAFRLRRELVMVGARVAAVPVAEAVHYLASPELSIVLVGTVHEGPEWAALLEALADVKPPWIVYGAGWTDLPEGARCQIGVGDFALLPAVVLANASAPRH